MIVKNVMNDSIDCSGTEGEHEEDEQDEEEEAKEEVSLLFLRRLLSI